ncbi:MAG: hypothetical protein IPK46_03420 [Saprospiraceae bacterium]|nr:hypothetical protein [Saprospiraceae bacterium]
MLTGISGITRYSPAITVSTLRDKVMYTHYYKNGYNIWESTSTQLLNRKISPDSVDQRAGTLPQALTGKKHCQPKSESG